MGRTGDRNVALADRLRFVRIVGLTPLARYVDAPIDGYVRVEFNGEPRVIPEWAVSHACELCSEAQLLGLPIRAECSDCDRAEREASPAAPRGASR